ncbi:MAG: dipeptidase [Spirochaetes bacterium]|nr:dipeptidase [Spirochaetota bacterium]
MNNPTTKNIPIIDLHSDTFYKKLFLSDYEEAKFLYIKKGDSYINIEENFHVTAEKIRKGNIRVSVQSLYLSNKNNEAPLKNGMKILSLIKKFIKDNNDFYQVYNIKDINENINKKYGILVSIEGLEIIENNLEFLELFYELGVRIVAPTWNRITPFMGNVIESYGLFNKGKELINKLNELKLIIDVSHMGEKEFYEVCNLARTPVIASHSNVWSINNHNRNLKDEQIKIIKELKGVIGINLSPSFLKPDKAINIENSEFPESYYWIYNIIDYLSSKFGDEIISFGADFDGIYLLPNGIYGIDFYSDFINFLIYKGLKIETIENICYKNFLNVFSTI